MRERRKGRERKGRGGGGEGKEGLGEGRGVTAAPVLPLAAIASFQPRSRANKLIRWQWRPGHVMYGWDEHAGTTHRACSRQPVPATGASGGRSTVANRTSGTFLCLSIVRQSERPIGE